MAEAAGGDNHIDDAAASANVEGPLAGLNAGNGLLLGKAPSLTVRIPSAVRSLAVFA